MKTNGAGRLHSDLAIPPGESLAEEIEARGMTQGWMAKELGMSRGQFERLIRGEEALTEKIAGALEKALDGISAQFWLNLENEYRYVLAQNKAKGLVRS